MMFKKSVDKRKFLTFLDELRSKYFIDDLCIYFDNLSIHKSKDIKNRMDELGICYIYGPSYSPDLSPIELVFSIAKSRVK